MDRVQQPNSNKILHFSAHNMVAEPNQCAPKLLGKRKIFDSRQLCGMLTFDSRRLVLPASVTLQIVTCLFFGLLIGSPTGGA